MSVQNFSYLTCLEVAEKFVVVVVGWWCRPVLGFSFSQAEQNYLQLSKVQVAQKEIETIFEMRSRVTKVKVNFRGNYENLECRICKNEEAKKLNIRNYT